MSKKESVQQPQAQSASHDGREIDILLPVFAKLGIEVSRPRPDVLAGIIDGLLDDAILWAEIYGENNVIAVQVTSNVRLSEEQATAIRTRVEQASGSPECCEGDIRWLRLVVTAPRRSGGREVALIAIIKPKVGELTSEFCEQKMNVLVDFMRTKWPLTQR